jgi:monothiol glutaredoxin
MTAPVFERIQSTIDDHDVTVFMKGTADTPMCGFSAMVVDILGRLGVSFKDVNVLDDPELRQGIKDFTNWPTIPQLYVKGEFIGGCDIVREMAQTGELQQLLKDKNILVQVA